MVFSVLGLVVVVRMVRVGLLWFFDKCRNSGRIF